MGDVLKQSSAASSGAGSATWGMYAEYYAALGFHASAREALLKQVRNTRKITSPVLLSSAGEASVLTNASQPWASGPSRHLRQFNWPLLVSSQARHEMVFWPEHSISFLPAQHSMSLLHVCTGERLAEQWMAERCTAIPGIRHSSSKVRRCADGRGFAQ